MIAEIGSMLLAAGWAGGGLVLVSVLLWSTVAARALTLGGEVVRRFEAQIRGSAPRRIEALRRRALAELAGGRKVLRALVVAAPLLGLLGTVGGMVELFDALHSGAGAVGRGSVAGGISTALVTTQLGLVVGVPGLVAARALESREQRLRVQIEERTRRAGVDGGSR